LRGFIVRLLHRGVPFIGDLPRDRLAFPAQKNILMGSFNLRVYGVLINEQKQVLVADEFIRGKYYTKFPGGGLEYGEGTRDCLLREFMEVMTLRIEVGDHIYTTD